MYRIVGADGKVYGPVNLEQIRNWIQEGRANAQTRIQIEGAVEWRQLGELPEFASAFAAPAPLSAPQTLPGSVSPRRAHPLATAGLILGIISLTVGFCCCYGIPFNLAGLVLSVVAWSQIGNQGEIYNGRGIAIAGIVLNALSLLIASGLMAGFGVNAILNGGWPRGF